MSVCEHRHKLIVTACTRSRECIIRGDIFVGFRQSLNRDAILLSPALQVNY